MFTIIIVRGPSGAGKSSWIHANYPDAKVVSADHFFMHRAQKGVRSHYPIVKTPSGTYEYRFDPRRLAEAHQHCFNRFLQGIRNSKEDGALVVDNTFIHKWEYVNYIDSAEMLGYDHRVVEFRPDREEHIRICAKRNTHGVPFDVVERMCREFEAHPGAEVVEIKE